MRIEWNLKTIVIIILIVSALAFISAKQGWIKLPFITPAGYIPLSVDRASVSPSPHIPGKEVYVLWLSTQEKSRYLRGYVDKKDIEQALEATTGKDYIVEYPLWIDVESKEQTAHYSISGYKCDAIGLMYHYIGTSVTCVSHCMTALGNMYDSSYGGYLKKCCCRGQYGLGYVYGLSRPTITYTADITVTNGKTTYKKTIGSITSGVGTEANFGNVAYAIWTGGLFTGFTWASETSRFVFGKPGAYSRITSNQACVWLDKALYNYNELCVTYVDNCDEYKRCIDSFNTDVEIALSTESWDTAKIVGNEVQMSLLDRPPFYNTIYMEVDAEWLGIYVAQAKPDITCLNDIDTTWQTSPAGTAKYSLKNIGNTGGTITTRISCNDYSPNTWQIVDSLSAGQSVTRSFTLTQSINKDYTSTCTLTAESTGMVGVPPLTDTCTFKATAHQYRECQNANQKFCEGNAVYFCTSDYRKMFVELCPGTQKCVGGECITPSICEKDSDCKDPKFPYCVNNVCVQCKEDKHCPSDKPKCVSNICMEEEERGCSSCFSWLWNKIKPGYCEPQAVFKLNLLVTKIEISQDEVCPYVNIFFGVVVLIVGLLIALFWSQIMLLLKRK